MVSNRARKSDSSQYCWVDNNNMIQISILNENININLFQIDMNYCLRQVQPVALIMEYKSLVDCLHTLIMPRSNEVTVERN